MKHIGIVGITAEGAALCYKTIVSESAKILGSHKHPEISLHNFPFKDILDAEWPDVAKLLLKSIEKLASIGADFAILPANSVHYVFDELQKSSPIPLLSIVTVTADACKKSGFKKVGVLGIGLTMSDGLYKKSLEERGIQYMVPEKTEQERLNSIIYDEIVPAQTTDTSVDSIIKIITNLKKEGCDGIILGCTELPLVINKKNCPLPFIDTTRLLAQKAVEVAIHK